MIDSVSAADAAVSGMSMTPRPPDDPAKIKDAAKQFEALLIGQMMKSMSDAEGGWLGTGEDDSASSAMEYAQESFAQALAANGGLGISAMVAKGLENSADAAPSESEAAEQSAPSVRP